jgi:hypothetical protein
VISSKKEKNTMANKKANLLVNLWELDGRGGSKLIRSGATRDPSQMLDAPPPAPRRSLDHVDCPRCRGTRGGPNPFVPERKCKQCKGLGFVLAAA